MHQISQHSQSNRRTLRSLAEASEYADVSVRTLRRRIADGSLVGYRLGPRLIRVDLNELDRMLEPLATGEAS